MFFNDWLSRRQIYTPDRTAVTDSISGRTHTYADMNRRACALAICLKDEFHIQPGDRIACLSTNRVEYLDLFFACGKLGAILVPLNYRLPGEALRDLVANCAPRLLVCEDNWRGFANALQAGNQTLCVASMGADGIASICERPAGAGFHAHVAGIEETAMILYTSGTTGQPKGAMISWRQIHWNAVNTTIGLQLTQDDVSFLNTPLYHTGGWHVLFTPLMHMGGRIVLQSHFDAQQCNELIARERLSILFGIPTTLRMMMEAPNFKEFDFSSLRMAICGGEPCPLPVLEAFHEKGVPVRQGYGLTEAGPNCFSLLAEDAMRKAGSVGFPNFHIATRIEKTDGSEAGEDEVGELLMGGPHAFTGYWNDPEATRQTLADGWVRTGDLFKRDAAGYHYVVGRKKHMFISGGENVYPAEIERVLNRHPAIAQLAVIGIPDAKWGEVGCAFVVFHPDRYVEPDDLRIWCRPFLAGYQCPKYFLPIEQLPLGASGKVDKITLQTLAAARLASVEERVAVDEPMRARRAPDEVVLFIHGNASSSIYWEEVIAGLPEGFVGIAPDLRGYGLSPRESLIDATRGVADWVDDIHVLLDSVLSNPSSLPVGNPPPRSPRLRESHLPSAQSSLPITNRRFHLVGHSLGGMVCWGLLADPRFAGLIASVTLVAPGPPCGFGGVHGPEGEPNNPDFSGSGAGLVHPRVVELMAKGERGVTDPFFSPRAVMDRMFWKPPFRPVREEAFLTAMLQVHLGEHQFPGDSVASDFWPGFAPGRFGPINAISAKYNRDLRRRVLDSPEKPPLLCVIGADDPVILDASQSDAGFQGKMGFRPGWPGEAVFPPQPIHTQLMAVLAEYEARGGRVEYHVIADCGHSPFIEKPDEFRQVFHHFLGTT